MTKYRCWHSGPMMHIKSNALKISCLATVSIEPSRCNTHWLTHSRLVLACDRDLSKSAQLACSTTAHTTTSPAAAPTPTTNNSNSRFSIIKQDLVRKKSKSTFKLFTALASPANKPSNKEKLGHARSASSSGSGTTTTSSNNTTSPSSPSPSTPTRPRTTSTYSEYILGLETSGSSIYHSSSSASSTHSNNSIKSQHSHESRLTLQSLASKELLPQQSSLHRLASESSASINQQRYFSVSTCRISA